MKLAAHPNEVADGRLDSGHWHRQVRDGFAVNFSFFMHDDQMGDLLGHRLQDTFYRFRVKNRHFDYFALLSAGVKGSLLSFSWRRGTALVFSLLFRDRFW